MQDTTDIKILKSMRKPFTRFARAALVEWGEEAQLNQVIEELAELITAINHYRRGRANIWGVLSEAADVLIMLEQLLVVLEENSSKEYVDKCFELEMTKKLMRLQERLDGAV